MPLKGGPKATQPVDAAATEAEKKNVVPAVVAATTAAVAVVSVVTSEAAPEDSATTCVPAAMARDTWGLVYPGQSCCLWGEIKRLIYNFNSSSLWWL